MVIFLTAEANSVFGTQPEALFDCVRRPPERSVQPHRIAYATGVALAGTFEDMLRARIRLSPEAATSLEAF
jgi:hypothetical protein